MKLFISTATDKIYLMTFEGEKIIKSIVHQGKNNHTETLYGLLDELEMDYTKIEKIYVINGPGSYTGLRVGVIYAKTLAMTHNIDIVPVGLMPSLYYANGKQVVNVDAKGKKYYTYDGDETQLIPADEVTGLVDPELDLQALLSSGYLNTLASVDYLKLTVEYIKNAI